MSKSSRVAVISFSVAAFAASSLAGTTFAVETIGADRRVLSGMVMEQRSGTPNVVIVLCDGQTGFPLRSDYQPFLKQGKPDLKDHATRMTDKQGRFEFRDLPDGTYRLVAQKWIGPFLGLFELHGTVIQLMGTANDLPIPRPPDAPQIVLTPPGHRVIEFQQESGNDETLLLLSTHPPAFDPILGFPGLGRDYFTNIVGMNRMPLGRTLVIGAPDGDVSAFLFAGDNLPGTAAVTIRPSKSSFVSVPHVPYIAAWSNGKKTPEGKIVVLVALMDEQDLTANQLLDIPPLTAATSDQRRERIALLYTDLTREVPVTQDVSARVGDILAAQAYIDLRKWNQPRTKRSGAGEELR